MEILKSEFEDKSPDTNDYLITLSFSDVNTDYSELLSYILTEDLLKYKSLKVIGVSCSNECMFYYNSELSAKTCICNVNNLRYISVKVKSINIKVLSELLTNITTHFVNLKFIKTVSLNYSEKDYNLYAIGVLEYFCNNLEV